MRIKKILIWLPAIVMAMIIFGFSKQDGEESSGLSYKAADIILTVCDKAGIIDCNENNRESMIEAVQFPIRKAAHMTEYAILFLLSYLATVKISMSQSRFYNRSIAVLISLLYACSDEMHQLLVPGRSGKMIDVGIDMAGVLIVLICMILSKNTKWKIICGVLLGVLLVAAFVALLFVPF